MLLTANKIIEYIKEGKNTKYTTQTVSLFNYTHQQMHIYSL